MLEKILLPLGILLAISVLPLVYGLIMLLSAFRYSYYPLVAEKDLFKVEKVETRRYLTQKTFVEWADGYRLSDSIESHIKTRSFQSAYLKEGSLQSYLSNRDSIIPIWKIKSNTLFRKIEDDKLSYRIVFIRLYAAVIGFLPFIILYLINYILIKKTATYEK